MRDVLFRGLYIYILYTHIIYIVLYVNILFIYAYTHKYTMIYIDMQWYAYRCMAYTLFFFMTISRLSSSWYAMIHQVHRRNIFKIHGFAIPKHLDMFSNYTVFIQNCPHENNLKNATQNMVHFRFDDVPKMGYLCTCSSSCCLSNLWPLLYLVQVSSFNPIFVNPHPRQHPNPFTQIPIL